MANIFAWLGTTDIGAQLTRVEQTLARLEQKVDSLMTDFATAKQNWVDYTTELKGQRDEAVSALTDAQATAAQAAEALAAFQADDAQTDAQQLADQAQAFADDLQSTLDGIKDAPEEPDPLPENPDDQPHPDQTLPGDLPQE